jgi:hypothetical protein
VVAISFRQNGGRHDVPAPPSRSSAIRRSVAVSQRSGFSLKPLSRERGARPCSFRSVAALPLTEIVILRERSSLWPGPVYAEKLAAGETLTGAREDVCWLVFDRRRGRKTVLPSVSWLWREA